MSSTSTIEPSLGRSPPQRLVVWGLGACAGSVVLEQTVLRPPGGKWPTFEFVGNGFFDIALFSAFLLLLFGARPRRDAIVAAALGAPLSAIFYFWVSGPAGMASPAYSFVCGPGCGALLVLAWAAGKARGVERRRALDALATAMLVPVYLVLSLSFLRLTIYLHPTSLDRIAYRAGIALGEEPSFVLGRFFARAPWLGMVTSVVYTWLPAALTVVYARRTRVPKLATSNVLFAFISTGIAGGLLYHAFPVVGPLQIFPGYPFDTHPSIGFGPGQPVEPVMRNCMPSLHTAWVLLLYWYARPLGGWFRGLAGAWLVLTELATLGLGYHYVIDLVVAFPFALTMRALFVAPDDSRRLPRLRAGVFGALLVGVWLVGLSFTEGNLGPSALAWVLMLGTVVSTWMLERALSRAEVDRSVAAVSGATGDTSPRGASRVVVLVFFLSGFAGLVFEVVFGKSLALTFGSTAIASTTVLATYMGGIALGSYLGGLLAHARSDALRLYARAEFGVAASCALTPWAFTAVRWIYVRLATGTAPGSPFQITLQLLLGAVVLLVPTVLMGVTLPLLVRHLKDRGQFIGHAVAELYGANTLGAAFGALAGGYVFLPMLGVHGATLLAVVTNLVASLAAFGLISRDEARAPTSPVSYPEHAARSTAELPRAAVRVGLVVMGVGGCVTLALESTCVHVLSVVAGNSTYAFSLMLFSFLIGLGGGSVLGQSLLRGPLSPPLLLVLSEVALALCLLADVHVWQGIPDYFASYASFPIAPHFAGREFIRFVVCFVTMAPPAVCIGTAYPIAIHCVTSVGGERQMLALGKAAALNTTGNIAGALLVAFIFLPRLGSLHTVYLLVAVTWLLALTPLAAISAPRARAVAAVALATVLAFVPFMPREFDYGRLASGANVYFFRQLYGKVIDHAEGVDGGLTTVAESSERGERVLTLLTNGKFQGDDSDSREMRAQCGFAVYPLLHTEKRDRALAIGLGTGVSARVLKDAGFRRLDVAELSSDVVHLATRYFRKVNEDVLSQQGVFTHITDGRNLLLIREEKYDLISLEISSIWFAGAANLYNREFYALVKTRLAPHGVLQQWVQLHRLAASDIASILATLRSEFRYVSLYFSGTQGVVVACEENCEPRPATLALLDDEPRLRAVLHHLGPHAAALLENRVLTPDATDRLLEECRTRGLDTEMLVSTDDNLLLEYETPKANVRDYKSSFLENLAFLRRFAPPRPGEGTALDPHEPEP